MNDHIDDHYELHLLIFKMSNGGSYYEAYKRLLTPPCKSISKKRKKTLPLILSLSLFLSLSQFSSLIFSSTLYIKVRYILSLLLWFALYLSLFYNKNHFFNCFFVRWAIRLGWILKGLILDAIRRSPNFQNSIDMAHGPRNTRPNVPEKLPTRLVPVRIPPPYASEENTIARTI